MWFLQVVNLIYKDTLFHFSCFNTVDQDDSSVGLMGGQLCIPGSLLRTYVFDPVVDQVCFYRNIFHSWLYLRVVPQVLTLVEEQMNRVEEPIHALFLVGGFAESEYLKQRVEVYIYFLSLHRGWHLIKEGFASRIGVIVRPPCADSAALRGAAQYGLSKRQLMSFAIAPRSYMIEVCSFLIFNTMLDPSCRRKVNLPAEQEDHMKRPAYIVKNDAGVTICQKRYALRQPLMIIGWQCPRLQYLLVKGSVLRKRCVQKCNIRVCFFLTSARQRSTATFRWLAHWSEIIISNLDLFSKVSQNLQGTTFTMRSEVPLSGYSRRFHFCHNNLLKRKKRNLEVHWRKWRDWSPQMDYRYLFAAFFHTECKHTWRWILYR